MQATRSLVAAVIVMIAGSAQAADEPAGAASCSGCHATSAQVETSVPRLAGRPKGDTADAMVAFKAGQRQGTIMDRIAKGFSDEEIQAIAAWYAEQK